MADKKSDPKDVPTHRVTLDDGVILWAWKGMKVGGPKGTFSSAEFGHGMARVVANDELAIEAQATQMQRQIATLNDAERDEAYQELLDSIDAVSRKEFG